MKLLIPQIKSGYNPLNGVCCSPSTAPILQAADFKTCSKCKQTGPLSEYYKGQYQCKTCCNKHQKKYRRTEQGKATIKRYRIRHPERIKIKNIVNHAIRAGKLPRPDTLFCTYCYKIAAHYHHSDYSKPLEVVPLCRKCHRKIHLAVYFEVR